MDKRDRTIISNYLAEPVIAGEKDAEVPDQPYESTDNVEKGEETCLDAPPNSPPSSNENLHEMSETTTTLVGKVSEESPTKSSTPNDSGVGVSPRKIL